MTDDEPRVSAAHRAGQVFVITLCVIAGLLLVGSWLAMRACSQATDEAIQESAPAVEHGVGEFLQALGNAK